jgi:hypothetical protein
VQIAGYGIADAEHALSKEVGRAIPSAKLDIRSIRRTDPAPRIVEEFELDYVLNVEVEVEAVSAVDTRRLAFAEARRLLRGTRFEHVEWVDFNYRI